VRRGEEEKRRKEKRRRIEKREEEKRALGSVVGWGTVLKAKVAGSIPNEVIGFYFSNLPNFSSHTMALGFIYPVKGIFLGRKSLPVRKA
jgi:hypothetical protein